MRTVNLSSGSARRQLDDCVEHAVAFSVLGFQLCVSEGQG